MLGCVWWLILIFRSFGQLEINLVIIDSLSTVMIQKLLMCDIIGIVTALNSCLFIIVTICNCRLLILFLHPVVDVIKEFSNSKTIIFRILLYIVVSCHFNKIRLKLLILAGFPESMSMTNMHNFVSLTMYNIYRTIKILYPVDIWKLVKPERPS